MNQLLSHCPACQEPLVVKTLACPQCNLELSNNFQLSPFDYLQEDELNFLICFLQSRGNFKTIQSNLGISYPTVVKKLDRLLRALNLSENNPSEELDMTNFQTTTSSAASAIIRNKLIESQGKATIYTYNGTPYEIYLSKDGCSFTCEALKNAPYEFEIFDCIVDFLVREGGRASKGQARGKTDKLGSPKCNEHTVTGMLAIEYYGKSEGDSVFDPVFILAGILEWAEIARNSRGYIELTAAYNERRQSHA